MSTELDYNAGYSHGLTDDEDFPYPSINSDAISFAYDIDFRPQKRVRLASDTLSRIDTSSAVQPAWDELESAKSLAGGAFPSPPSSAAPTDSEQQQQSQQKQRSASVPPRNKPGRKKKTQQVPQDGPFIQESFAFPDQQTWLKPKPRQRKSAVEVSKDTPAPSSEAPDQGEALSLDKHADRIAALIARKRKENDSKLFRERMSVQQRLHRGEQDSKDRAIAASHEELKRKMELSAKGIFEEKPPEGKNPDFISAEQDESLSSSEQDSNNASSIDLSTSDTAVEDVFPNNEALQNEAQVSSDTNVDDSDVDEEIILPNAVESPEPLHQGPSMEETASAYIQYMPSTGAYYQAQIHASVTTQKLAVSTQSAYPQPSQLYFSQPRFANHRFNNPHIMWQNQQPPTSQPQPQQQWPSQVWQSLPSTSTPLLQPSEIVQSSHTPQQEKPVSTQAPKRPSGHHQGTNVAGNSKQHDAVDFFGVNTEGHSRTTIEDDNANTTATSSALVKTLPTRPLSSSQFDSHPHPRPPVLKSNVNMFTRQARENGVIGGNNNYSQPPTGETRRNMFANRP